MGSFNVTCCISHLSISPGDPAVFIPLKMKEDAFAEFGFQFYGASRPLPAITGIYDDYGRLCNIDVPNYYQYAENGDKWIAQAKGQLDGDIEGWTYTWVHGDVYAAMVAGLPSSELDTRSVIAGSLPRMEILKKLGFVEMGETGIERYSFKLGTPDVTDRFLASDGTWADLWIMGEDGEYHEDEGPGLYTVQRLINAWPTPLDVGALDGYRHYDWVVVEALTEYRDSIDLNKRLAYLKKEGITLEPEDRKELEGMLLAQSGFSVTALERKVGAEGILESGTVLEHLDDIKSELADMAQFRFACATCGILITPSAAGPQCGDHPASFALADLIRNIAEKNLKAHSPDDDDDE